MVEDYADLTRRSTRLYFVYLTEFRNRIEDDPMTRDTYQGFFLTLIDWMIGFLVLIIKVFDNQTEIFRDLVLIFKAFDNQTF